MTTCYITLSAGTGNIMTTSVTTMQIFIEINTNFEGHIITFKRSDDKQNLSTLDKLLGQLGIYATWLSSIAYLQKQLRIFIYFYATFLAVIAHVFLLNEAIENVPTYLLSLSAFLSIKLADFYRT